MVHTNTITQIYLHLLLLYNDQRSALVWFSLHLIDAFKSSEGAMQSLPCILREYPSGSVCVCNATYCDTISRPSAEIDVDEAFIYTSSKSGKRFELSKSKFIEPVEINRVESDQPSWTETLATGIYSIGTDNVVLKIDPNQQYQKISGFGAAFTDSAGINAKSLSKNSALKLMESYFGPKGIEYGFGRVPIASCDFSTHVYSYCDTENDFALKNFSLSYEDFNFKIPLIKQAVKLSRAGGNKLHLLASPWSAPAWMKETGKMKGGGRLKGKLNGIYYQIWAKYFLRFFNEYAKNGIKFWGVTIENEPSAGWLASFEWQAMFFDSDMQREFVKVLLGPALRRNPVTANITIMAYDDNRIWLPSASDTIFSDPNASEFIQGIGVHWYWNSLFSATRLTATHERHPTKFILPTEASNGAFTLFPWEKKGPILGDWSRGESYAQDIIENLENWAIGWMDWNFCLSEKGGPNWVGNFADSPILVNATGDEFYKQPMYYTLGHFSKFIRPGSVRIGFSLETGFYLLGSRLIGIAVLDPRTQRLVIVLLNHHSSNNYQISLPHPVKPAKTLNFEIEHNSIATVIFNAK